MLNNSTSYVLHRIELAMTLRKWTLALSLWLAIIVAFAGAAALFHRQWTVPGNPPNLGDRPDQCEALHVAPGTAAGTILEPENTWSNAAYLLIGLLILLSSHRPLGRMMGLQFCMLAIFSGLYHAALQDESSGTFDARALDVSGIYFVLWAELCYALQAVTGRRLPATVEWGVGVAFTILSYLMALNRFTVFIFNSTVAVCIFVAALVAILAWQMSRLNWQRAARPYLWIVLLSTAVGVGCRFGDRHGRILCAPNAAIQAHALWHVFTALTLVCVYDFFAWSSGDGTVAGRQRRKPDP